MGRLFGIVFIVLAIWAGLEVFTKGTGGAFGGLFGGSEEVQADATAPRRAEKALERAYDKSTSRVDEALGE